MSKSWLTLNRVRCSIAALLGQLLACSDHSRSLRLDDDPGKRPLLSMDVGPVDARRASNDVSTVEAPDVGEGSPDVSIARDAGTPDAQDALPDESPQTSPVGHLVCKEAPLVPFAPYVDVAVDGGLADGGARDRPLDAGAVPSGPVSGAVTQVQVLGPTDVLALTSDESRGMSVQHWNGASWEVLIESPSPTLYLTIWASSLSDIWLAKTSEGTRSSQLLHFDGARWNDMSAGVDADARITAVWGVQSDDLWVSQEFAFSHWNGRSWQRYPKPNSNSFSAGAFWGAASNDVWAGGSILSGTTDVAAYGHWDGRSWTIVASSRLGMIKTLWGTSNDSIWSGGINWGSEQLAIVEHFDGNRWQSAEVAEPGAIQRIWGTRRSDIWAAGTDEYWDQTGKPLLLHYDGDRWSHVTFSNAPTAQDALFTTVMGTQNGKDLWLGWGDGDGLTSPTTARGGLFHCR